MHSKMSFRPGQEGVRLHAHVPTRTIFSLGLRFFDNWPFNPFICRRIVLSVFDHFVELALKGLRVQLA